MAAGPGGHRDLVGFQTDHSAPVRHGEEAVVAAAALDGLEDVVGLDLGALLALRVAVLDAELVGREALEIAAARHGHEAVLLDDEGARIRVHGQVDDLRAARAAELGHHVIQLALHLLDDGGLVGQQAQQVLAALTQRRRLGAQLVLAEAGEAAQLHGEDRVSLLRGARDQGAEAGVRRLLVLGLADHLDDLVDLRGGCQQTLHDVLAVAHALQLGRRLAAHALGAEVSPAGDGLDDAERGRLAVVEQRHVDREGGLEARVQEELLQRDAAVLALFQVDDDADLDLLGAAVLGGLVADVLDLGNRRLAAALGLGVALAERGVGDLLDEAVGRQAERDGRDHDAVAHAPAVGALDRDVGADLQRALAGAVRLGDLGGGAHEAPGREVGAGHQLHQLAEVGLGAVRHALQDVLASLGQLGRVVRWDL